MSKLLPLGSPSCFSPFWFDLKSYNLSNLSSSQSGWMSLRCMSYVVKSLHRPLEDFETFSQKIELYSFLDYFVQSCKDHRMDRVVSLLSCTPIRPEVLSHHQIYAQLSKASTPGIPYSMLASHVCGNELLHSSMILPGSRLPNTFDFLDSGVMFFISSWSSGFVILPTSGIFGVLFAMLLLFSFWTP